LLQKTIGHLNDALSFTLAIPRQAYTIRLFCIWPLWMAMETVAVLQNNRSLIESDDPVKISRSTVKKILRRTPLYCFSDFLLKRSFASIINGNEFNHSQKFDIDDLKNRLNQISLDNDSFKTSSV
ncbi:MAG: squalene/phytoene synthase, partial [Nitrospinales bacterium]